MVKEFPESEIDIAQVLLKHYVQYPWMKERYFPYNYCLLDKVLGPWSKPIIDLIC